jgi:hypothetical protein
VNSRKEIGGGFPNALAPLVASWKAARATAEPDAAPKDSATPVPAAPPAAVSDLRRVSAAMDGLAAAVLADVTERIEAVRIEADKRVQAEREAVARVVEQHRAARAVAERDRGDARVETAAAEAEADDALAEVDALTEQLTAAKEQVADLDKRLIKTAARADAAERGRCMSMSRACTAGSRRWRRHWPNPGPRRLTKPEIAPERSLNPAGGAAARLHRPPRDDHRRQRRHHGRRASARSRSKASACPCDAAR